jgi:hypothetical protein
VSEYDKTFSQPPTYHEMQLARKGRDQGTNTVRMVVTNDRGKDTETTDSWNASGQPPNVVTHLAGAIVPPPSNWASLIVNVPAQGGTSPVDSLGKFDVPLKGVAGGMVRVQVLSNKSPIYDNNQKLPGPITITLTPALSTSGPAQQAPTAGAPISVRGQVVDQGGQPVASAKVVIPNIGSADTDASGAFQISSAQLKMGETFQVEVADWRFIVNSCVSSISEMYTLSTEPITIRVSRGATRLLNCPAQGSQNQPTQNQQAPSQQAQSTQPQTAPAIKWPSFTGHAGILGTTKHFTLYGDTSLGTINDRVAPSILQKVEVDYNALSSYYGVQVPHFNVLMFAMGGATDGTGGADHMACEATDIEVDIAASNPDITSALIADNEAEVFQAARNKGEDCGTSNGEGLARALHESLHPNTLDNFATAPTWANSGKPDFINKSEQTDQNAVSTGASVLFYNWLHYQLGYSWEQICKADGKTPAQTYSRLTNRKDDAFQVFLKAIDALPNGVTSDNPFLARSAK